MASILSALLRKTNIFILKSQRFWLDVYRMSRKTMKRVSGLFNRAKSADLYHDIILNQYLRAMSTTHKTL